MNRERLERLIVILEGVKQSRKPFTLWGWAGSASSMAEVVGIKSHKEACGTACCAAGYAALDPELQAQGFSLQAEMWPLPPKGLAHDQIDDFYASSAADPIFVPVATAAQLAGQMARRDMEFDSALPQFDGKNGMYACAAFFDVTYEDACFMFLPGRYSHDRITPMDVIARVREVMTRASSFHDGEAA